MATATATNYVFDLTNDDELIASQLQKIVTDTNRFEAKELIRLSAQLNRENASERMHNSKLSKRAEIYERAKSRLTTKEQEYEKARYRARQARGKMMDRTSKSAAARERAAQCERRISEIKARMGRSEELYQEDAFERRALMIRFVESLINTEQPIKLESNGERLTLSWETNDIYIKDGFGGFLDHCFGRFRVSVVFTQRPTGNTIDVYCRTKATTEENFRRGYPHPHLNYSSGHACLGNLAPRLIHGMGDKDVASVIQDVSEFLMHYNKENPYVRLEEWIPNRWDNLVCESNEHLLADCTCPRCSTCGAIFEESDLSDCGSCHSCCMVNHIHSPDTEGINGSSCIERSEYNTRVRTSSVSEGTENQTGVV